MKEINKAETYEILMNDVLRHFEEQFNSYNEEYNVTFNTSMTYHTVDMPVPKGYEGETKQVDVAYFRVSRYLVNKTNEEDNTTLLIYNAQYPFEDVEEKTNSNKWKKALYKEFIIGIMGAGLEYIEQLENFRQVNKRTEEQKEAVISTKGEEKIQVTSEMPGQLNESELEYKEWAEKNNENSKK
jgi:hypothetical protein